MVDLNAVDYSPLDVPEVLLRLFHPRPEFSPGNAHPEAASRASFHLCRPGGPARILDLEI